MTAHARYIITNGGGHATPLFPLEIEDVGPWDRHPTVTNDMGSTTTRELKCGRKRSRGGGAAMIAGRETSYGERAT